MTDVAIVGGGLAGLSLAVALHQKGRSVTLIEARDRLGGRIHHRTVRGERLDLGPAWFWPGQPRMAAMVQDLGLTVFDQYATGDLMFEDAQGTPQRGAGFSSMEGSFRLVGGMSSLIQGLASRLPPDRIRLQTRAIGIDKDKGVLLANNETIPAEKFVLAIPPRVAATLSFSPTIPVETLSAIPTWMGGQAKILASYDQTFWRDAGLSGDAMSRRGPMIEIHDASPQSGAVGTLFGFVGVPPAARKGQTDALLDAALAQLAHLFGPEAADPIDLHLEDWATQPQTAAAEDQKPLFAHPDYGLPPELDDLWQGMLHFGSSETATGFGGYLEGALERAEALSARL